MFKIFTNTKEFFFNWWMQIIHLQLHETAFKYELKLTIKNDSLRLVWQSERQQLVLGSEQLSCDILDIHRVIKKLRLGTTR